MVEGRQGERCDGRLIQVPKAKKSPSKTGFLFASHSLFSRMDDA